MVKKQQGQFGEVAQNVRDFKFRIFLAKNCPNNHLDLNDQKSDVGLTVVVKYVRTVY